MNHEKVSHTPSGLADMLWEECDQKFRIETVARQVFAHHGYKMVQTPTFEYYDVYNTATPNKEESMFKFFDVDGRMLALRPDFTPSIARCGAAYFAEERAPLRFAYVGNTFTNTVNLQGKLKEVTQMGAELLGDGSVEADGEVISLVVKALKAAGLRRFQISIGQVEYFKGLCEEAGLDEETAQDLRGFVCGKNYFAAQELLQERGVDEPYLGRLLKAAELSGGMGSLQEAGALAGNDRSLFAVRRLEKLYEVLKCYGTAEYVSFDLGMLNRYYYYTGVIFRAYTYGMGDAIVKGGRYDNLLSQFGKESPAVGFAMVVDSILEALSRQDVELPLPQGPRTILYGPQDYGERLKEAERLRAQGICVALQPRDMGQPREE